MGKELGEKKRGMDKRLLAPTIAVVVLAILEARLENLEVGIPFKILIKLLWVFGVAWWATAKSRIDNMRDELYKKISQQAASLTLWLGVLVLLSSAQLQEEGLIREIDLRLSSYGIIGAWIIIYFVIRRRYISGEESN